MITCENIREESPLYLDGDQPLLRRLGFFLHLVMCRACRAYMRQIRTVRRVVRRLPRFQPRHEVREEVRRQFKESSA